MILHIIHASTGGTYPIFEQLAMWDKHHGHQALAWGTEGPNPTLVKEIQEAGLRVSFIRKAQGLDVKAYWKIAQHIRKLKPQQIILHSVTAWPGVWLAKQVWRIPFRLTVPVHTFPALQTRSEKWALASAIPHAEKVICFTEEMASHYFHLIKHENIQVIPHILDREFWKPLAHRPKNKCLRIGYHGRLIRWKGILEFPQYLLEQGEPFQFEAIGEGPDREAFIQVCNDAGLSDRIKILPPVSRSEIRDWLQTLDIWICFSQGETMGLSAMEAEACGARLVVRGFHNRTTILSKSEWVDAWLK